MSVQICPVCNGSGKYTPPWDKRTTGCPMETVCHGCGGKGWVTETIPAINYDLNSLNQDKSQFTVIG